MQLKTKNTLKPKQKTSQQKSKTSAKWNLAAKTKNNNVTWLSIFNLNLVLWTKFIFKIFSRQGNQVLVALHYHKYPAYPCRWTCGRCFSSSFLKMEWRQFSERRTRMFSCIGCPETLLGSSRGYLESLPGCCSTAHWCHPRSKLVRLQCARKHLKLKGWINILINKSSI